MAPEILNTKARPGKVLDYSKQPVWAAGVLVYELAGHDSPFKDGRVDQRGYNEDNLPPLATTNCMVSNQLIYRSLSTVSI